MKITVIEVTKENMIDIVTDDSVYVIKDHYIQKGQFMMEHIKKAKVNDLLSDDVLVVRVTKE